MTNDRVGPCARAYTTTSDDDCRRYQGVFGPPEYYTQHDTIDRGRRRGKAHRCTELQQKPDTGNKHQQQKKRRMLLLLLLLLLLMVMMTMIMMMMTAIAPVGDVSL